MREGGRGARGRAQQPAEEGGRNQPTAKNRWQTGEMRARVILPEGSSLGGDDDDGGPRGYRFRWQKFGCRGQKRKRGTNDPLGADAAEKTTRKTRDMQWGWWARYV